MDKDIITPQGSPPAVGPYSHGVKSNGFLFISGLLPLEPSTGKMAEGGIGDLTRRAMDNMGAVLEAAGLGYENLVKVTIFTTRLEKFGEINEAYGRYFKEAPPARAVVGVAALPKGAVLEIEATAACHSNPY